jgi:hypothetical protein
LADYEESFLVFQKALTTELKTNRIFLVSSIEEIQEQKDDFSVLDRVGAQLTDFQAQICKAKLPFIIHLGKQRNKVINLRA